MDVVVVAGGVVVVVTGAGSVVVLAVVVVDGVDVAVVVATGVDVVLVVVAVVSVVDVVCASAMPEDSRATASAFRTRTGRTILVRFMVFSQKQISSRYCQENVTVGSQKHDAVKMYQL